MQEKLILLRQKKNISQIKLATLLDISPKQYRKKELGESKFNGDEMFKISEYFNLKIDDIFLPSNHQNGD